MICPNCGRRNPAGATFCSRCRQRLPLAARYSGAGYRRAVIAEPSGGGSGGVLVLGVALLAGFLFIGGGAAIYLSTPASSDPGLIGLGSPSPGVSLPIFVQETPTPDSTPTPTATPFFTPTPTPIFTVSPTPTFFFPTPTPTTTPLPTFTDQPTQEPTETPTGPDSRFGMVVDGQTVSFQNKTVGSGLTFEWNFGDGRGSFRTNPKPLRFAPGDYTVTLIVTDGFGHKSTRSHPLHIDEATPPPTVGPTKTPKPTDDGTPKPTKSPTPVPTDTPVVTPAPTATPTLAPPQPGD